MSTDVQGKIRRAISEKKIIQFNYHGQHGMGESHLLRLRKETIQTHLNQIGVKVTGATFLGGEPWIRCLRPRSKNERFSRCLLPNGEPNDDFGDAFLEVN
jgi:hypothetical protein